jgi:hypothetical protein
MINMIDLSFDRYAKSTYTPSLQSKSSSASASDLGRILGKIFWTEREREIIRLIMVIQVLLKYFECVEKILDLEGMVETAAESRLEARISCCLAQCEGPDRQL